MSPKASENNKTSAKDNQSSGTRVEVTLPVNQATGMIPPVLPPQMSAPFNQPFMVNPGLGWGVTPTILPGTVPMPTGPPNIIVAVPPREGKGASDDGSEYSGESGRRVEEKAGQAPEEEGE